MWYIKCMIVPVIIGATGYSKKNYRKCVSHSKQAVSSFTQKTASLGTLHIIRKVLQSETGSLSGGNWCWFGRRSARGKRRGTMNDTVTITTTK